MSVAKKCDRCGELYEVYNSGYNSDKKNWNGVAEICVSKQGGNYIVSDIHDLCGNCLRSYKRWWDEHKRIAAMVNDFTGPDSTEVIDEEEGE